MVPEVFVDADVLYSPTLRGWLFNLSVGPGFTSSPAFEPIVSEDVIAEAVARWRDANPTAPGGVVTQMSSRIRELCSVIEDFNCEIPFPGEDEGDIHVHAAASASGAGYLVTRDGGFHDLPEDVKDTRGRQGTDEALPQHPKGATEGPNARGPRRLWLPSIRGDRGSASCGPRRRALAHLPLAGPTPRHATPRREEP